MYLSKEKFPIDVEQQSVEVPDSDGVRQSTLMPLGVALEYIYEDSKTLVQAFRRGHRVSNDGPCLGTRDSNPHYKWMKYGEVIERAQNISYGLVQAGLKRGQESFLGIYSQNRPEWVLVEYACFMQSVVTVPLYETLGPNACTYILNQVDAEFLVCDTGKKVKDILSAKKDIPKLRNIILIEEVGTELKALAVENGVTLHHLKDVEELGKRNPDSLMLPSPSDLATVCFTSGTTGNPKGVMLTHGNMVANVSAIHKQVGNILLGAGDRYLSFLPMAHMLDRICQAVMYINGGCVGFFRGDLTLIFEDIKCLQPTFFPIVPRILNRIYDKVQSEVSSKPLKKLILNMALRAKKAELERGVIRNNSWWDCLVLKKIRDSLGGEVKFLITGGAPIRDEVLMFFRCSFGCLVSQAYGQTECTAGATLTVPGEYRVGNVGPPVACCFVKLADVPDMGYYAKNGEGEVLVKGPGVMKGYLKDPVKTAEALDENGWLYTGDIGRWEEKGVLAIIDRKKSILKLSQGEYVSPEKVEAVYVACPYVEQMFVHGNSLESCLVAIIVPNKEELLSWCSKQNIRGDLNKICENEVAKKLILKELSQLGVKAGLKGFEQVKAIHLHTEPFTQENGLLTVTMKTKRIECQKRFKSILQAMYDGLR